MGSWESALPLEPDSTQHTLRDRDESSEAKKFRIALLGEQGELVDLFEAARRSLASSNDDLPVEHARAHVWDAVLVRIRPANERREEHEAAGGLCWTTSDVLRTRDELDRFYNAKIVHEEMQRSNGVFGQLNLP